MEWPLGIGAFAQRVDDDIASVVDATLAQWTAPIAVMSPEEAKLGQVSMPDPDVAADTQPEHVHEIQHDSDTAADEPPAGRKRVVRACVDRTRRRIQDTLEWENCDEQSGRFLAVAQQFDDAFNNEELEDAEMDQVSGSESMDSITESDDDESYESSFVTDGSGSDDDCSEDEWTPQKKICVSLLAEETPTESEVAETLDMPPDGSADPSEDQKTLPDAVEPAFLHMEEFGERRTADGLSDACESGSPASVVLLRGEQDASASFLHAEELNSPPGFYNLWVL